MYKIVCAHHSYSRYHGDTSSLHPHDMMRERQKGEGGHGLRTHRGTMQTEIDAQGEQLVCVRMCTCVRVRVCVCLTSSYCSCSWGQQICKPGLHCAAAKHASTISSDGWHADTHLVFTVRYQPAENITFWLLRVLIGSISSFRSPNNRASSHQTFWRLPVGEAQVDMWKLIVTEFHLAASLSCYCVFAHSMTDEDTTNTLRTHLDHYPTPLHYALPPGYSSPSRLLVVLLVHRSVEPGNRW